MYLTLVLVSFMVLTTIIPVSINADYKKPVNIDSNVTLTIRFNEDDFEFDKFEGYDIITYPDGGLTTEIGKPMLPSKNILVALPNNIIATNIKILKIIEVDLLSTYNIFPAQAPQKVGLNTSITINSYNIDISKITDSYPSQKIELIGMTDLAGQGLALVTIYPFQYTTNLKTLKLIREIKFVIEGENGYNCGDYLPNCVTESEVELYKEKLCKMVVNPENVILQTKQGLKPMGIDPGNYNYVIITKNDWASAFQTLADWKTQKGIPANIVTTESIYANYSSSTNQAKIRAFIQDAHNNWGTNFFLLGGDTDTIPYQIVTYNGDDIPTDTYYSDYDDDWTCEVHVGRASVTGPGNDTGKIGNFISKTLNYEKNPPTESFAKNISLFGFDLDGVTEGEDCKIDIDNLYIPSNWTITRVYDSHSGNHEDNVDAAVNSGQNLINHIDHSNEYYMGTGYINHNRGLNTSEVDDFSNGDKQATWYSIGCWAAAIDFNNCIAEHFVRDSDGGGVGFIGNTRYGWYWVGGDDLASLRYDRYFFRSFFIRNHYKLGDLFSDHKMEAYNSMDPDDLNKYIFSELILLGDPELPLWMNDPASFVVFHPSEIYTESSSFTVHVETTEGDDIENASVCLWKGDEVYLTNLTDSTGDVTFNISPITEGNMTVTVTKQDYIPYEGNVLVISNQPPDIPSNPNPPNGANDVNIDTILSWDCSDPDGDPLTYDVYFGTSSPPPLVYSNHTTNSYDPGILNFETTYFWEIIAWDDSNAYTTSPIWSFTTKINNPPNSPSNPIPPDGATNVTPDCLEWTGGDPDGDFVKYDVFFGKTNPPQLISHNITETIYCTYDSPEFNTTYYWKIVAWDEYGASTVGSIWSFTTKLSQPPEAPNIDGPNRGKTDTAYDFTFNAVDPEDDDVRYHINWADGDSEITAYYISGTDVTVNHTWTAEGIYTITVQAEDIHGSLSPETTLKVNIPKVRTVHHQLLIRLFERFPNAFLLLRYLLGIL